MTQTDRGPAPVATKRMSTGRLVALGLAFSLFLAGVVSVFAATTPDGLEYVSAKLGFEDAAAPHAGAEGPFAEYAARGVEHSGLATAISGVLGVLVVAVLAFGLMYLLRARGPKRP